MAEKPKRKKRTTTLTMIKKLSDRLTSDEGPAEPAESTQQSAPIKRAVGQRF